jgi:hypothetical protein
MFYILGILTGALLTALYFNYRLCQVSERADRLEATLHQVDEISDMILGN